MLKFYYAPSVNPNKVALFLEEVGLPYEAIPIDARRGEQHAEAFRRINPNGKLPAIEDDGVTVFDSSAILLYLAEKTGQFLPPDTPAHRGQLLSWLMWSVSGLGVFTGQYIHFRSFSTSEDTYAVDRYAFEAERHWTIVEQRLGQGRYMLGETYTIADMAIWGWARMLPLFFGYDGWDRFPNVKRLHDEITDRPAAARVEALAARFEGHFKREFDEEAKGNLFPHTKRTASANA